MKSLSILIVAILFASCCGIAPSFENESVLKTVDLKNAIITVTLRFVVIPKVENQKDYYVVISKADYQHLAYITAYNNKKVPYTIKKENEGMENNNVVYRVSSQDAFTLQSIVIVKYYLTHVLSSLPAEMRQKDTPKYVYMDYATTLSPYTSAKQDAKFKLPSQKYESITMLSTYSKKDNVISYGSYPNVPPFSQIDMVTLHFPLFAPFRTFENVEREIEVSHWGNVAVEEVVHAKSSSTPLTGEFSRWDYINTHDDSMYSWDTIHAKIDRSAQDIYYRDIIGNVTTSSVRKEKDGVDVTLKMRFPMMGGWKNNFYWGYNVPSGRVLRKQGSRYSLTVPFSTPLEEGDIQHLTVHVILPECAKNVRYVLPEDVKEEGVDYRYTYLDTSMEGRPVYSFSKNNLIDEQKEETITISYDLNPLMLWREPLMCIGAFFALFLLKAVINVMVSHRKVKTE